MVRKWLIMKCIQQNLLNKEENAHMATTCSHSDSGISVLAGKFLEELAAHKYSAATVYGYRRILALFSAFLEGRNKTQPLDITPEELAAFRLALVERRLMQNSVYTYLRAIGMFCAYLHEHDHVFVNPVAGMKSVGPDRRLQPAPTEQEVAALLALPDTKTALGIRDRAMLETLYGTAVRKSEAVGMNVGDMDLAAATIRVKGKGGHERVVPLGSHAVAWIGRYLGEVREGLKNGDPAEPALWLDGRGHRMSGQVLAKLVKHYAKQSAEIKTHVTTHSLRRACATHMLQHGANPVEIQLLLGHADLTHLKNYLRLNIRDLKAAHEKTRVGE